MRKNGFTLIEVMVVGVIIGGLITVVAVVVPKINEQQRQKAAAMTKEPDVAEKANEVLRQTRAKGGHSYVPVNRTGTEAANSEFLLQVMADFEAKHPEFELYDVDVDKQQTAPSVDAYVYGVRFHYHIKAEAAEWNGK